MAIILTLKSSGTVRRGKAHFWSVIRELTEGDRKAEFSVADIFARSNEPHDAVIGAFLRLATRAGILRQVKNSKPQRWAVVRRPVRLPTLSADGRVVMTGRQAIWNAIRALQAFTAAELAVAAATEDCPIDPKSANDYVLRLKAAGYLKIERPGKPGRPALYRLRPNMNTGPLPPQVLRAKIIWDQNREQIVGPVEAEEVTP